MISFEEESILKKITETSEIESLATGEKIPSIEIKRADKLRTNTELCLSTNGGVHTLNSFPGDDKLSTEALSEGEDVRVQLPTVSSLLSQPRRHDADAQCNSGDRM